MEFGKIIEWIKLSPRYLFAISLISGVLIFSPNLALKFGLSTFINNNRPWIGLVFLVSTTLCLTHVFSPLIEFIKEMTIYKIEAKAIQKRLQNLTHEEKALLRGYFTRGTRTQYLRIDDGVVAGLESEKIIFRASNLGGGGFNVAKFAYNITDGVWRYLLKHPNLISGDGEYDTDSRPTGGFSNLFK